MLDMTMTMGEWRPRSSPRWPPRARESATLWAVMADHRAYLEHSGELSGRRRRRALDEFADVLVRRLEARVRELEGGREYQRIREAVVAGEVDPYAAVDELLDGSAL